MPAEARSAKADVAQLAEHVLGKDEVTSSILVIGSIRLTLRFAAGEPQGSLMAGMQDRENGAKRVEGQTQSRFERARRRVEAVITS